MKFLDQVIPALPFRSRVDSGKGGGGTVVRVRDLAGDGVADPPGAACTASPPGSTRGHLESGDVVLRPCGHRPLIGRVGELTGPIVATAPVRILHRRIEKVHLDVLAPCGEATTTRTPLHRSVVGTDVPKIPGRAINAREIDLPSRSDQHRLAQREAEWTRHLGNETNGLFSWALKELANESGKHANTSHTSLGLEGAQARRGRYLTVSTQKVL